MKRKLSAEAIERMKAGGRKASKKDKASAGRKGYRAMIQKAAEALLSASQ